MRLFCLAASLALLTGCSTFAETFNENPHCPGSLVYCGTRVDALLGDARETGDLGAHFGSTLYAREVDYLMAEEWARTADDILWRRTKLGLRVTAEDKERLAAYMAGRGF